MVGPGLLVLGLSTYVFLALAGRALPAEEFGRLSVLYALVFGVGAGVYYPFEQQVSRLLSSLSASGAPPGRLVPRTVVLALVVLLGLGALALVAADVLADELFGGERLFVVAAVAGLLSFAVVHITRGVLSGRGRFVAYSTQLALEGLLRTAGAVVAVAVGWDTAGVFCVLLVVPPLLASALVAPALRGATGPGPGVPWTELTGSLGLLVVSGLVSQLLANAGPVVVAVLARPDELDDAGRLLAALVLVRVPLFLFAAVQAALVPDVAAAASRGDRARVEAAVRGLLLLVVGLGAVMTLALAVAGPLVLRTVFGPDLVLPRLDLVLLAVGGLLFLVAQVVGQAAAAGGALRAAAAGWLVGLGALVLGLLLPAGVVRVAELSLLLGAAAAAVALSLALRSALLSMGSPA